MTEYAAARASSVGSTRMLRYRSRPVPAGISFPMITFSFRPRSESRAAVDRRVGEHPGGLLEGGRREPRLGRQRGLGDAHQHRTTRGRLAALGDHPTVLLLEQHPVDQVGRAAGWCRPDSMTVTRRSICRTMISMCLSWIDTPCDCGRPPGPRPRGAPAPRGRRGCAARPAGRGCPAVSFWPTSTWSPSATSRRDRLRDGVLLDLGAVVGGDEDLAGLVGLLDLDAAGGLGDRRTTLGRAGLEELDHAGQTLRDVVRGGHTTGVEGTHRQLRAGLTDRLGGDDADRLADVDELAGGQRAAVALGAGAGLGVAGQHGADLDLLDAGRDELVDLDVAEVLAGGGEHLAGLRVGDLDRPPSGRTPRSRRSRP